MFIYHFCIAALPFGDPSQLADRLGNSSRTLLQGTYPQAQIQGAGLLAQANLGQSALMQGQGISNPLNLYKDSIPSVSAAAQFTPQPLAAPSLVSSALSLSQHTSTSTTFKVSPQITQTPFPGPQSTFSTPSFGTSYGSVTFSQPVTSTIAFSTPNSKAPPVNVVITASDPLPSTTSTPATQPILSVTIPPQHLKGNNKVSQPHNYQIPLPATTTLSTPAAFNQTPLPVATQSLLSHVAPPIYSAIPDNKSPMKNIGLGKINQVIRISFVNCYSVSYLQDFKLKKLYHKVSTTAKLKVNST